MESSDDPGTKALKEWYSNASMADIVEGVQRAQEHAAKRLEEIDRAMTELDQERDSCLAVLGMIDRHE